MNKEIESWKQGYEAGKNMAKSLSRPVKTKDFPKDFHHRGSSFWRGYAEGVLKHGKYNTA